MKSLLLFPAVALLLGQTSLKAPRAPSASPPTHAPATTADTAVPVPLGDPFVYKVVDGEDLQLWVISPPRRTKSAPHPAIVFFHGGGWRGGQADQFNREATYLAGRGIVAVQVEYRLMNLTLDEPISPCMEDAKSAMRWVRSHAAELGADPDRIGALGESAGGQLAAFLGGMKGFDGPGDDRSVPARADALILFNPAVDLGPTVACCRDRAGKDYKAVSPFYHVHSGMPPTLIFQGTADRLVSPATVEAYAAKLKNDGVQCDLFLYSSMGHGFAGRGENFYRTLTLVDEFLRSLGWLSGPPDDAAIHRLPEEPVD